MYKKASSPPPYWQSILTKIKNLGLRPEIMAMLNNFNQIVWDTAPPASNPNAVAYVSSEDKDSDGKIDKIHFVLNKFPPNANEEDIDGIVEMVAKTLVHEYGHIEDFDAEKNEFPGGEGAAEQAERAFEPMLKQRIEQLSPANNLDSFEGMPVAAQLNVMKALTKLANNLDRRGYNSISDDIDLLLGKIAAHSHEDYMSEFHAKSIEDSAEEIIEDLEEGKELDPWQKSYLAQADIMTDSVQERLEQEDKLNSMANALDKMFKY